jgi:hypothetical protein
MKLAVTVTMCTPTKDRLVVTAEIVHRSVSGRLLAGGAMVVMGSEITYFLGPQKLKLV